MDIKLTINYTDDEYLCAAREKIEQMPKLKVHTYAPIIVLFLVVFILVNFALLNTWWGISLTVIIALYAIPSLFGRYLIPYIALAFAKKKKLQETYDFSINTSRIKRSSEQGEIDVFWSDLQSIDETAKNFFFNLNNGSMLLPKARFSDTQLSLLNSEIMAYKKSCKSL